MRGLFASLVVALTVASASVSAGEFIEIESGTNTAPIRVVGYMAKPPGAGPFAAVVLLHGCGGFHASMMSWADRLSRMGYVALAVDSFGSRGIDQQCSGGFPEQVADGYAALRLLSTRPFVRASHVALMGFSQGGLSVLTALERPASRRSAETFRAGIAFYPICQYASGIMTVPVLVVVGAADTWTPHPPARPWPRAGPSWARRAGRAIVRRSSWRSFPARITTSMCRISRSRRAAASRPTVIASSTTRTPIGSPSRGCGSFCSARLESVSLSSEDAFRLPTTVRGRRQSAAQGLEFHRPRPAAAA
jgi:dienelactone hydrolase